MKKLLVLGAGGHGKVIGDCALQTGKYNELAFLDDRTIEDGILGFPVVGKIQDYEVLIGKFDDAFVAIGNNRIRVHLLEKLTSIGYNIPSLIHPASYVSKFVDLKSGSAVLAGAVVNAGAKFGLGCIINTCASIDHDCIIDRGVHISPGARVGGTVHVGEFAWICLGACVANNLVIGENSIIAAGAAVIDNIENNVLVAGVPAVVKKRL